MAYIVCGHDRAAGPEHAEKDGAQDRHDVVVMAYIVTAMLGPQNLYSYGRCSQLWPVYYVAMIGPQDPSTPRRTGPQIVMTSSKLPCPFSARKLSKSPVTAGTDANAGTTGRADAGSSAGGGSAVDESGCSGCLGSACEGIIEAEMDEP